MVNNHSGSNKNLVSVLDRQFSCEHNDQLSALPKYFLVEPQSPLRQKNIQGASVSELTEQEEHEAGEASVDNINLDRKNSVATDNQALVCEDTSDEDPLCDDICNKNSPTEKSEPYVSKNKTNKVRSRPGVRKRYRR
ncbi:hypothetical protein [Marinomonas balearica]|uniref:Uncharacterized protein n=1 Tax=Marinomonas balearica TaxID=491947 RepID=A0A4R6M5T9_9GAMM|nr:hypothetical protein [Marinomonas balearica]TDO96717.1 hypothetical protein DFP79_2482 [Marinomonas balearica]